MLLYSNRSLLYIADSSKTGATQRCVAEVCQLAGSDSRTGHRRWSANLTKRLDTKMSQKKLIRNGVIAATAASAIVFASVGSAATSYFENFEALDISSPTALGDAGWLVGGCDPVGCYFAFPAPNGGDAFSAIVSGQGGPDQGGQQLSVYNDYNNPAHAAASGDVEAFVFYNIGLLDAEDANTEISFSFDTKAGSIAPPTTARAFLLVQKTSDNSFAQLDIANVDTTNVGADWTTLGTSLVIDPTWVGETLQIGFTSTAREFNPSGVFYDNLNVGAAVVPVPAAVWLFGSGLLGLVGVARRRKALG